MKLEMFINFNGNCREAVEFYAKVFKVSVENLTLYSDAPPDPNFEIPECDKNKVMYASIPFGNMTLMFMDYLSCMEYVAGNLIIPSISTNDKSEIIRIFNELKEGGYVEEELNKTFYSELYGCVRDKFGITWHVLLSG